jgi:DNA-directed RNA polymerase specialized sigma54-like protein
MKMIRRRCFTLEIKKYHRISLRRRQEKPLPDDQLAELLKEKGYPIARRTIAKQRATGYPVRMRRRRYKIHPIFLINDLIY